MIPKPIKYIFFPLFIFFILLNLSIVRFNAFTACIDIIWNKTAIVSSGLPILNIDKLQSIAQKHGFQVANIGCSTSFIERHCLDQYNFVSNAYLSLTKGKNWRKEYDNDVNLAVDRLLEERIKFYQQKHILK